MSVQGEFAFASPGLVSYGPGSRRHLPADLDAAGVERVLLLVSGTLYEKTPHGREVEDLIGSRRALTFAQPKMHVPREVVIEVARLAREAGVDGIVSLGGGSVSDLGKAVGLALAEGISEAGRLDDFKVSFDADGTVREPGFTRAPVPHWTLPTTLSAAEFTSGFGITDGARGIKDGYNHPGTIPKRVVMDAELTLSTPMELWLSTGVRAVDHCVEAIYSHAGQPFITALCRDGLVSLARYLPWTKEHPEDLDARTYCQIAAWQGGFAITNAGVGVSHAIGHQIGARYNVAHGITSCVLLPASVEFNASVAGSLSEDLAGIFGAPEGTSGAAALRSFVAGLGLPTSLAQVDLGPGQYDQIIADTLEDRSILWNPRHVDKDALTTILHTAQHP